MAKTRYLSEAEKREGQKHLYLQEMYNGIGYSWLGDTIVYLMAIYFSASNIALGYISAAAYITGVVLPFVPRIFHGKNHIKVQSTVWAFRGFVCLLYLGLYFLSGKSAVVLLLVVYTLFNLFRMIGVALHDSTVRTVSSSSNRGRVVAGMNTAYQGASVVVRIITAVVLSIERFAGLVGLLALQVAGVVANFLSARQMAKIPSRTTIMHKKGRTVGVLFKEAMADPSMRRRLILRWLSLSVSVVFALTTPFLRVEVGLSNSMVVTYSVILSLAVMVASYISKHFSDRLGSRPLVIFSTLFSLFFFLIWSLISAQTKVAWIFVLGFFTNFFVSLIGILTFRLVTQVMPDDETVAFNSMVNFVIAIIAFVIGIFSGFLADLAPFARTLLVIGGKAVGNGYTFVFLFAIILTALEVIFSIRLQEGGAYTSQAAAQVLFSRHGLRAVSMIEKLQRTTDPAKRRFLMLSLGENFNNLATSELRQILASPFSPDKREAVRTLADRPRKALLDDLIRVAQDDDSYVQLDAIAALGAYRKEERAKQVLLNLMQNGRWASVRSMASKSLARVSEGTEYLNLVNELSHSALHIDETIDFLVAKRIMDKSGSYLREFFISIEQGRSPTFRQTRYAVIDSMIKFDSPRLAQIYERMNLGNKDYLSSFLSESRDLSLIDLNYSKILSWFAKEDWEKVRELCVTILETSDLSFDELFDNLKCGLLKAKEMNIALFDIQDMLAMLYFSYSLGKNVKS
ncbi:MAG: MFS transporter [Spirochaetota bacterium]|nr:MFS transporter [Spirochaetota bacterium]